MVCRAADGRSVVFKDGPYDHKSEADKVLLAEFPAGHFIVKQYRTLWGTQAQEAGVNATK